MLNDDDRLQRGAEARKLLANISRATFYRNIERGIISEQRYMGGTPIWRWGDLRKVIGQLPQQALQR